MGALGSAFARNRMSAWPCALFKSTSSSVRASSLASAGWMAAPLLLASQKISAASLVAALATMFQMPLVHLVAGTVSSMITFAAETTIG